tara:strand:- start:16096 stop:16317 length:222 start_codon:yes stop_codon:yes gene_type:complete
MASLVVDISLPREQYLQVYQSYIRQVKAVARDGKTVRFPISVLKPYLTHQGIFGTFRLSFDDQNKFVAIEALA